MKHKIYMRDWYFNAGIVGFLNVISDGDKKSITGVPVTIGENLIEFEDDVLDNFFEKFKKQAFLKLFNKRAYLGRLEKNLKDIEGKKDKKGFEISKKTNEIEKSPYLNFLSQFGFTLKDTQNAEAFHQCLSEAINAVRDSFSQILCYEKINKESLGKFLDVRLKGVCSYQNILGYIESIKTSVASKKLKNKDICPSCQKRKASLEFNNAISNIIGFNKDNSNWIWGYSPSKMKICPLCALIYNCAFISFAYTAKMGTKGFLNYFYLLNHNTDLQTLWDNSERFNLEINLHQEKPLYAMIKETVRVIRTEQAEGVNRNINFIEMVDNPILAGQGTKGYNLYSYNLDSDIARFLNQYLQNDKLPKGYYKIKNIYTNIDEELLKLAIQRQIDYSLLYRYISYYLQSQKGGSVKTDYNLYYLTEFILKYIQTIRGENKMEEDEKIIKKAFRNGIELRNVLIGKEKKNQINGIVYGLLNDLKISDREKFLDKYLRLIMSHQIPSMFGQNEMLDKESFLHFGYSFINGLMKEKQNHMDTKEE